MGIVAKDGVVIATEKKPHSPLVDQEDWVKCFQIANHMGCVYSGLGADARLLARRGRKEAEIYRRQYDEPIPTSQASRKLGDIAQDFTQQGGVRPFGVSLLLAGYDKVKGPSLYQIDPSGLVFYL